MADETQDVAEVAEVEPELDVVEEASAYDVMLIQGSIY
jgi:hypothetical protein